MTKALNIQPGARFGRLTLERELDRQNGMRFWQVKCDCGVSFQALQKSFSSGGKRRSCGCQSRQEIGHGLSNTPEYRHWVNMISRAENPNTPGFQDYGGRGIAVCTRWRENFANFYEDMGRRPSRFHSVDRIDVNGNYEPENCRWATRSEQNRNQRSNHLVEVGGRTMTLAGAVEVAPVPYNTVLYRLKRGWAVEEAVTREAHKGVRPNAA